MNAITTLIIGAGQAGLAMSKTLTDRSIDHVLIERGEIANSWAKERWDSLRLLTPNWQSRLPGQAYRGSDPDGYMTSPEVVRFLQHYAGRVRAPVIPGTRVTRVVQADPGYQVTTDQGIWRCRRLVIASGACNIPAVPQLAEALPRGILSLTPAEYRSPQALPPGSVMIVGASASGVQLAHEIRASGREVILCVGEHVRLPRLYRGRDIMWWMDALGLMDVRYTELDDLDRGRRLPSPQLIGTPERASIDLNGLRNAGVELLGRLVALRDGKAQFSGSLANLCALADLKMKRMLSGIDSWIEASDQADRFPPPCGFEPTVVPPLSRLGVDLKAGGIAAVLWATGYRPDYSWLDVPVLDGKGRIRHEGGVVAAPGMYVLGLPFLRRRKSSFIDGAGADAAELAAHLALSLDQR